MHTHTHIYKLCINSTSIIVAPKIASSHMRYVRTHTHTHDARRLLFGRKKDGGAAKSERPPHTIAIISQTHMQRTRISLRVVSSSSSSSSFARNVGGKRKAKRHLHRHYLQTHSHTHTRSVVVDAWSMRELMSSSSLSSSYRGHTSIH